MANVSNDQIQMEALDAEDEQGTKSDNLMYRIDDVPPWYLALLLGFQQYLTMLSGIMALPYLLAPALCISDDSPARAYLLSSMMFGSGIVTVLQTVVGVRLPIIQGGTFSFLIPILNMLSLPEWKCPTVANVDVNVTSDYINTTTMNFNQDDIWQFRLKTVQGSVMVASLLEVFLGLTGCVGLLLHLITPLTIVPTITLIGLSLLDVTTNLASQNWPIAFSTIILLLVFSQAMTSVKIPLIKCNQGKVTTLTKLPIFSLIPVLLSIVVMWSICAILTATNVLTPGSHARTDGNIGAVKDTPWLSVPYPGQWGTPSVSLVAVVGLFAGVIASIVESIGDYHACARFSGASPPPAHAINRGIMMEGVGCVIAGLFGNAAGSTSYSENVGAIGITRVGSRRVTQIAGVLMMVLGVFTKFGAFFITIPSPIIGGIFFVVFGMITAAGLSNLQFVNLNSTRNLAILGFSLFFGLATPRWIIQHRGAIQTGSVLADQVLFMLLSTNMLVGGFLGCLLDNIIPGSAIDRGILAWRHETQSSLNKKAQDGSNTTYDIPYVTNYVQKWRRWTRFIPICPTFEKFGQHSNSSNPDRDAEVSNDKEGKIGNDNGPLLSNPSTHV